MAGTLTHKVPASPCNALRHTAPRAL